MPTRAEGLKLTVKTPCTADWDSMAGNEQVRFCEHCEKSVHNLSAMTRKDALRFARANAGGLCVRFYRGPGGRTVHAPAAKLRRITRRASKAAAGAFGAFVALGASVLAQTPAAEGRQSAAAVSLAACDTSAPRPQQDAQSHAAEGETKESPSQPGEVRYERPSVMGDMVIASPENPLVRDVSERDARAAKELIALGVDVNAVDRNTRVTALIEAVTNGDAEMVSVLMGAGADVNKRDEYGDTALTSINENATAELVRALIRAGAKVNHRNARGETALMAAAQSDAPEVLKTLIEAGAKVNAKNEEGRTPLMYAADMGQVENARMLLEAGADVNAKDADGETALKLAKELEATESEAAAASAASGATEESSAASSAEESEAAEESQEPQESEESNGKDGLDATRKLIELLISYGAVE